jgi:hypothetical protein
MPSILKPVGNNIQNADIRTPCSLHSSALYLPPRDTAEWSPALVLPLLPQSQLRLVADHREYGSPLVDMRPWCLGRPNRLAPPDLHL